MNILALDASSTAVGWALFEDDRLLGSGVLVPPPALSWWYRIEYIEKWLCQQVTVADVLAYEIASGRHGNLHTDRVLGAVEYVVRLTVDRHAKEFMEVYPQQVKATECSKDNLDMAEQVKGSELHYRYAGDEADAIGVGMAAWGIVKQRTWETLS